MRNLLHRDDFKCGGDRCNHMLGKQIRTRPGKALKFAPDFVYAYCPLVDSLRSLFGRQGFEEEMNGWRNLTSDSQGTFLDVYDGIIWQKCHRTFLHQRNSLGLMLNLDWFQPYETSPVSLGALYIAFLNLPRTKRFKPENVIVLGIIPYIGGEPRSTDTFIQPLIDELLLLEKG